MLLQPKKIKHRKPKKGKLKKLEFKNNKLKFGHIGLKSFGSGLLSARQLEASRRAIVKKLNRKGKLWLRVFPDYPVTKKPNESRMGKGKGNLASWSVKVAKGTMLFEIAGVPSKIAAQALRSGGHKLTVRAEIVFN